MTNPVMKELVSTKWFSVSMSERLWYRHSLLTLFDIVIRNLVGYMIFIQRLPGYVIRRISANTRVPHRESNSMGDPWCAP